MTDDRLLYLGARFPISFVSVAFAALACVLLPLSAAAQANADSAWAVGDVELAGALYESQLGQGTPNQRALHRLALLRAWSDRYHESLELFDQLLAVAPANVEASLDRAKVLSWQNDLQGAADAYADIVRDDPANREARLGLARVLSWGGRTDAAERVYHDMLSRDPLDAEALAGYARMAGWDGRLAEAERRWRVALDRHPDDVVLLTGLGATLRWSGRPGAAAEVLERAVELAPDNKEAHEEYRLARMASAPRIGPSATYESDSDGNRMATLYIDQSVWPSPDLAINTSGYMRTASLDGVIGDGQAYGGLLELRLRAGPGWELHGGGGATYNTLAERGAQPQWRARIATPGVLPAQGWVRVASRSLDETAPLMANGIDLLESAAGVRGAFKGFSAEASFGMAWFDGSERNVRRAGMLAVSRRVGSEWNVGAVARAFGFEKQLADGYFNPDFYGLVEANVTWENRYGNWHLNGLVSPGAQKVTSDGTITGSIRARAGIGHQFGEGQIVWFRTGYSTTGLTSFSTGAADYRYFHAALSVGWAF